MKNIQTINVAQYYRDDDSFDPVKVEVVLGTTEGPSYGDKSIIVKFLKDYKVGIKSQDSSKEAEFSYIPANKYVGLIYSSPDEGWEFAGIDDLSDDIQEEASNANISLIDPYDERIYKYSKNLETQD